MVSTTLELAKVFLRLDQPNAALDCYREAEEQLPRNVALLLGQARVHDMLGDMDAGVDKYAQAGGGQGCMELHLHCRWRAGRDVQLVAERGQAGGPAPVTAPGQAVCMLPGRAAGAAAAIAAAPVAVAAVAAPAAVAASAPGCAPPTSHTASSGAQVLAVDPGNVESIACTAAHHFYGGQPELALRFYRRLLQVPPAAMAL
jgi:hypothetical protein